MEKEFNNLIEIIEKETGKKIDEEAKGILMLFYEYGKKVGKDGTNKI